MLQRPAALAGGYSEANPQCSQHHQLVDEGGAVDDEQWLRWVEIGRITGHALARCSACGERSMLSVVNSSGTRRGRPSTGWPRCPYCGRTGTRVIDEPAFDGVERVKHAAAPSLRVWARRHGRDELLALDDDDATRDARDARDD